MLAYRRSTRRELCALLAASAMLGGCLGDPKGDDPPIDAGCNDCDRAIEPPPPDAGPPIEPPYRVEGGELRLERFQESADDSEQTLAAQAFFFKGQSPGLRLFGEVLPLRRELVDRRYTCLDRSGGISFDNGKTPEGQAIADTREYYDVGETATLTSTTAPTRVVTLERFLGADDPEGAIDPSSGLLHDVLYKGDAAQRIPRNTTYRPEIAGSVGYPALDLKWGETSVGEDLAQPETGLGTPQIYMPSAFTLTSPTDEEFFTPGFLLLTRGQDLMFTYTFEPAPADWPSIVPYAYVVDDQGGIAVFCARFPDVIGMDSEDGEFILPQEALAIAPPTGRIVLGRLVHAVWEYEVDTTLVGLIGMESKRSPPYTLQDALPEIR
jgi:hypothetical protein